MRIQPINYRSINIYPHNLKLSHFKGKVKGLRLPAIRDLSQKGITRFIVRKNDIFRIQADGSDGDINAVFIPEVKWSVKIDVCDQGTDSSQHVVIEKAEEKDRPYIFELLKHANMHYVPSLEMPELTFENYFVAKVDDQRAGFCGYKILSPLEAKTELMVVDQKYRSKGVGYKLQAFRMEEMLKKGIRKLTTNTDLPETISWYKKHFGYKEIGVLKKLHEFGSPNINQWTTLQVDLQEWNRQRKAEL